MTSVGKKLPVKFFPRRVELHQNRQAPLRENGARAVGVIEDELDVLIEGAAPRARSERSSSSEVKMMRSVISTVAGSTLTLRASMRASA